MSYFVNQRTRIEDSFVSAVFNINVDEVRRLVETAEYDKSLFGNVCSKEGHFCPINWIPQMWEEVFAAPEYWREDCREKIIKKKEDNDEIKRILIEELGLEFTLIEFENNELWIYDMFLDESFEEFFDETKKEMVDRGHKVIDLELYYNVNKYKFEESEKLLQLGANPNYQIPEEGSWCFDLLSGRSGLYSLEIGNILFDDQIPNGVDYRALAYLMAWAMSDKMYNLLAKYSAPEFSNAYSHSS